MRKVIDADATRQLALESIGKQLIVKVQHF